MSPNNSSRGRARSKPALPAVADVVTPEVDSLLFHNTLRDVAEGRLHQRASRHHDSPSFTTPVGNPPNIEAGWETQESTWLTDLYARHEAKQVQKPEEQSIDVEPEAMVPAAIVKRQAPSLLASIWSSLRAQCMVSSSKRLRVAEVASLGEKRFVALVNVEGREFLVGGGASGVSLLTPLGSPVSSVTSSPDFQLAEDAQ